MASVPQYIKDGQVIIDVEKGIEHRTFYTMTEVIRDEVSKSGKTEKLVALFGSMYAEEVLKDLLLTLVSTCDDLTIAEFVWCVFMGTYMRTVHILGYKRRRGVWCYEKHHCIGGGYFSQIWIW